MRGGSLFLQLLTHPNIQDYAMTDQLDTSAELPGAGQLCPKGEGRLFEIWEMGKVHAPILGLPGFRQTV